MAPPKPFINSKKLDIEKQAKLDGKNYNGITAKIFNKENRPTSELQKHDADGLKKNDACTPACEKENMSQEVLCCLSIVALSCIGLGLALMAFAVSSFFSLNVKFKMPSEIEVALL